MLNMEQSQIRSQRLLLWRAIWRNASRNYWKREAICWICGPRANNIKKCWAYWNQCEDLRNDCVSALCSPEWCREEIRATPEALEKMISSKHFLSAANLLIQSFKAVNSKEMKQIGALDDLRRTMTSQKNVCLCELLRKSSILLTVSMLGSLRHINWGTT